ncbi:MAG TPA: transcription termination/antitermination protein NusG [Lacipirellulaceae bacterium]|nr:transcription termination/antitermination protein NusG [Lacipirellulaceae bacterium]
MTDNERSFVADDAVSNRSDDTAIDEGDSAHANGLERTQAEQPSAPGPLAPEILDEQAINQAKEPTADLVVEPESPESARTTEAEGGEGETAEAESGAPEPEVAEQPTALPTGPIEETPEAPEDIHMDWYILKVQSNRERSIAEALERKMKIEGYERYFDQVIVPTEKVTEFKAGKKKVVERKLYPGYIVVHMHINDDTWFAVRDTSGVGDFTGAGGKPTPMLPQEVARIIQTEEEETSEAPKLDIKFTTGDKVKVKEGNFESFEGEVNTIDEASGRVTVMINIFGRSTPVELEYWQIEAV